MTIRAAILPAACLLGVAAVLATGPAAAQPPARDVKCVGCVDTRDLRNRAVNTRKLRNGAVTSAKLRNNAVTTRKLRSRSVTTPKLRNGAVTRSKLSQALRDHVDGRDSFLGTSSTDGAEVVLATHGPLRWVMRCRVNFFDEGDGRFEDQVEVFVTSSQAGWWFTDDGSGEGPLAAGDEEVVFRVQEPTGEEEFTNDIDDGAAMAPDGSYTSIDGETIGLGVNVFGHGCLAIGHVNFISADL